MHPWLNEPDYHEWDAYGLPCRVLRNPSLGILNGYVGVPPTHALYGRSDRAAIEGVDQRGVTIEEVDIIDLVLGDRPASGVRLNHFVSCHAGVTYGGSGEFTFCHLPKSHWWFGFDTGHAGDLIPSMIEHLPQLLRDSSTYRNFEYVVSVTTELAEQLARLEDAMVVEDEEVEA